MTTMHWTIRATDPITAINELDLRITAYELYNDERMADTVKRGVLLKGLAPLAEVQKHVMKDSARLNSDERMRAEVVDLLRAEAALHMPMDVDGACLSGLKGKGKMKDKGKGKTNDPKGKGKSKGKGKKVKEIRVCHECNKPGHLRRDCFVYKTHIAEKRHKEKVETSAAVQGAMVETWEYAEEDYVFAFGEAVIAAVQRPETHICIDSGASRSACIFGYTPDVTAKGTSPPLYSIDWSSIEQSGYKRVHWEKRDPAGEMKRIGSTMVESSVLLPVASVSSLEENGTSVVFSCPGDYYLPSPSSGFSHLKLQKRNGTCWLQADRRVTVDDKSSVNMLTGFSPVQMAPIQEGGAASSTDPDQCALKVRAKPILETPTQRQRDIHELTHLPPVSWCPAFVYGIAADNPRRRRQDSGEYGLDFASFDHADISAEVGMANKKLKFKVLVSHNSGSVAALEGPKDVTEHMVRFVCDMLETWGFGVCILKCQNAPAEITLQNTVVTTRQVKTIPRNTPRYSHGSFGHCESVIKEVEKRYVQCYFKCTLITTLTVRSFLRSCRFFLAGQTRCIKVPQHVLKSEEQKHN